jgi:ATP-dependent exoDNAse (exonuclease V) beta subunit
MTTKTPLALAFPLRGSQLIEASAGTGKTFTISALYLRLVPAVTRVVSGVNCCRRKSSS